MTPTRRAPTTACLPIGLVLLVIALLTGCMPQGYLPAGQIENVLRRVVTQHRAYVTNDDGLTDLQRRTFLRDGILLERALDEALKDDEPTTVPDKPVSEVQ